MPFSRTAPLRRELARALAWRPFAVEFWDGTGVPATTGSGPTFTVRSPTAIAHLLRAPGELGLGRAYVSGELAVDDLDGAVALLDRWQPPSIELPQRVRLALAAARACGLCRPPRTPELELRPRGKRHSPARDARAVRHHYDVSNDFFALFLDSSMTYSCALFSRGASTLEEAQQAKLSLVCSKLALEPGERVLDVGCGWGSFPLYAAERHGARVLGITLSAPQARLARQRATEAGLDDRVEIRVMDYRELTGDAFDAIASIGMVEHVGSDHLDLYARRLAKLLRPGGRLLNQGIARLRPADPEGGPFSDRYVFPDGDPPPLSRVLLGLERAGFWTEHVEGLLDDYVETLGHWIERFDDRLQDAVALAGAERVRVWRLYLRAARLGFHTGFSSAYQVLCRLPAPGQGPSGAPRELGV